jgi:nucleotide-binding universal stress UspA family protein
MRETHLPSPAIIVGVDGSRNALTAALWAVDEAVERDIPLRLVHAIDPGAQDEVRALACAETAIRRVVTAVESTGEPVKIEVEITHGRAADVLREAGRSAVMMCIGVLGSRRATAGGIGSTAAALANSASCPVAVIRGQHPGRSRHGSILVEVDHSPDADVVLERGVREALLRHAPLVVAATRRHHLSDFYDHDRHAEENRCVEAELSRRLERWTRKHPELDARAVAVRGDLLGYLARQARSTQLVVVGRGRAHGIAEMVGPSSRGALHDSVCSVLVCDPHNPL